MAEPTTISETTILQVPTTLGRLIEALIFAAQEPLTVKQIQTMYEHQDPGVESRRIESAEVVGIVQELNNEYATADKPYRIVEIAGGFQFATLQLYAEWLGKLYKEQARRKLSQSSIETLAIIAYKQPIIKPEIESIRGVNCDYVLKTLLEKDLVTIVGRATTVGRPLLYGTTKEFLKHFGLNEVTDLPRPREIEEILGEGQFETERRMLEAQEGLLQKKEEEDFKSRLPHIPKKKPELDEEVKIIPRKRMREIKVREDGDEKLAEKGRDETPTAPSEDKETATAGVPEELQSKREVVSESAKAECVGDEPTSVVENQQATDANATQPASLVPMIDGASLQEEPLARRGDESLESMSEDVTTTLENAEATMRESPPEFEEIATDITTESIQQTVIEDTDAIRSSITEEDITVMEDPPRPVPSPLARQFEAAQEPQLQQPTVSYGQRAVSPQKSRWQTWKEKIQGFIKNLFG